MITTEELIREKADKYIALYDWAVEFGMENPPDCALIALREEIYIAQCAIEKVEAYIESRKAQAPGSEPTRAVGAG